MNVNVIDENYCNVSCVCERLNVLVNLPHNSTFYLSSSYEKAYKHVLVKELSVYVRTEYVSVANDRNQPNEEQSNKNRQQQ